MKKKLFCLAAALVMMLAASVSLAKNASIKNLKIDGKPYKKA